MKNKIKIICLSLCAAVALSAGSLGTVGLHDANADVELIIPQEYALADNYAFGDTLTVPNPSSVRIKTGAVESVATSVVLRMPDGAAKSEGTYVLEKGGKYQLTYYSANGASATQSFTVYKNYYGVNNGATARWEDENFLGKEDWDKEGIEVVLTDNSSFSFNKSINLYDYEGQALEVCKIFPMFKEEPNVNPAATTVSVKVVDCYDPSKFVEFYLWSDVAGYNGYYSGAGASTQVFTGLEQNANRAQEMTELYDGQKYKIHRPSRYQSSTAWGRSMGTAADKDYQVTTINPETKVEQTVTRKGAMSLDGFTLIWDLATHQMKFRTAAGTQVITDIDSTEIYGVKALDFDSFFTTGDVYLNVQAYNYAQKEITVGLEEVFGFSGSDLWDAAIEDTTAPSIFVDVEPTEDNTIYLQKGKPVQLPKIVGVLDYNYYGNERLTVYRNYGKRGQAQVSVENGIFTPEIAGNYTAVYTATDGYGNTGEYLLHLNVLEETNIAYTKTPVQKLVAAKTNVLPYIEANGLNKAVKVKVFATAPNGDCVQLDENGVNGYNFLPTYAGEYTITYLFEDNVYVEEYTYTVNCVDENDASFSCPFALPAYFMKGASYSIDPVSAYTAGNGGLKEQQATVSVSVDGGDYQPLTAAQMQAYKVEGNETLQFKATYGENSVESKLYEIVDVGFGKKSTEKNYLAYMQGNYNPANARMVAADSDNGITSGMEYTFAGDAKLQFINLISSANFKTTFRVDAKAVQSISVFVRDARQPELDYVEYTYTQVAGYLLLNAKQYMDGKLVADEDAYTKFTSLTGEISMEYSTMGMTSGEATLSSIRAFAADDALLEIAVNGAMQGCKVKVSQVMNQKFSPSLKEAKPQLTFGRVNGVQEGNSIYAVQPCYSSAALSSVLTGDVLLTVKKPGGEVATSEDGIRLENVPANRVYALKLGSVGQYRVEYKATCVGSSRTKAEEILDNDDYYTINVSEGVAPTLSFDDGSNEYTTVYLPVGSQHKIKSFTVSDNTTDAKNIKVYTMVMDSSFILEENGYNVKSYVFRNVGTFVVYVVAFDELGNSSEIYYNVVVS